MNTKALEKLSINNSSITIIRAESHADYQAAKQLFIAYQKFLDVDLCFQSFDAELQQLPLMYGPPQGALLLAMNGSRYIGCVAFRKKDEGICEMKRLFVEDDYKHQGIGRSLVENVIATAKKAGYQKMILDTLERLAPAINLYHSFGFTETSAYYSNPLQRVVYMQLEL